MVYDRILCVFLSKQLKYKNMEHLLISLKILFILSALFNQLAIVYDYAVDEYEFELNAFIGWFCAMLWCINTFIK